MPKIKSIEKIHSDCTKVPCPNRCPHLTDCRELVDAQKARSTGARVSAEEAAFRAMHEHTAQTASNENHD